MLGGSLIIFYGSFNPQLFFVRARSRSKPPVTALRAFEKQLRISLPLVFHFRNRAVLNALTHKEGFL